MTCDHPVSERWQAQGFWFCCKCWSWFRGDKRQTPKADIYGRTFEANG